MTQDLESVAPLAARSTDTDGHVWLAASVERWTGAVRFHMYCVTVPRPERHDDVVRLDLSWAVVTDEGERRATTASAAWLDGVWAATFTVRDVGEVREIVGYRDRGATRVLTLELRA